MSMSCMMCITFLNTLFNDGFTSLKTFFLNAGDTDACMWSFHESWRKECDHLLQKGDAHHTVYDVLCHFSMTDQSLNIFSWLGTIMYLMHHASRWLYCDYRRHMYLMHHACQDFMNHGGEKHFSNAISCVKHGSTCRNCIQYPASGPEVAIGYS